MVACTSMVTHIQVSKHEQETSPSVIRRFTKRVQESGVLSKARTLRAWKRAPSRLVRRKQTLKLITRRTEVARLVKLGKMPEKKPRRGR